MLEIERKTRVLEGVDPQRIPYAELLKAAEPTILKGVVAGWEIARVGAASATDAIEYLAKFDSGRPVVGYTAEPDVGGRFFYNADVTGLNFEAKRVGFTEFLGRLKSSHGQLHGLNQQA